MTLGSMFGLSLIVILIIAIVIIAIVVNNQIGIMEVVPFFSFELILAIFIWLGVFAGVTGTDAFSSKSISWAEHNISKLEQKIENSDKEYDIIRYQTKIQKWEKTKNITLIK